MGLAMTTRPWRCGLTLQAVLVAVVACSSIAFGQDSANLRDDTAERLLEALDERGMPDVSLWLLERLAQPDAGISAALRSELAYLKALALVGVGRTEPNAEKRRTTFEQAQQAIDAFLASPVPQPPLPQGADELDQVAAEIAALDRETRRINANIQQGKLHRERARLLQAEAAKQAKASISDQAGGWESPEAAAVFNEAVASFRAAERLITSSPIAAGKDDAAKAEVREAKPADAEAGEQDSLLARVRQLLEQVDAAVGERRPRPARGGRSRTEASRLLREWQAGLSERQSGLQNKLLEVRLLLGEGLFEVASALQVGSAQWLAAVEESIAVDKAMYEKYRTLLAGQFARVSQGRSEAALARAMPAEPDAAAGESARDKQFTKALATLSDVRALSG